MKKAHCITVEKDPAYGLLPMFVKLGIRHLEKEAPSGRTTHDGTHFTIPIDLLFLSKVPGEVVEGIEEVELVFSPR